MNNFDKYFYYNIIAVFGFMVSAIIEFTIIEFTIGLIMFATLSILIRLDKQEDLLYEIYGEMDVKSRGNRKK